MPRCFRQRREQAVGGRCEFGLRGLEAPQQGASRRVPEPRHFRPGRAGDDGGRGVPGQGTPRGSGAGHRHARPQALAGFRGGQQRERGGGEGVVREIAGPRTGGWNGTEVAGGARRERGDRQGGAAFLAGRGAAGVPGACGARAVREAFVEGPRASGDADEPAARGPGSGGRRGGIPGFAGVRAWEEPGGGGESGSAGGRDPGVPPSRRAGDDERDVSEHQPHRERDAQCARGGGQGEPLERPDRPGGAVDGRGVAAGAGRLPASARPQGVGGLGRRAGKVRLRPLVAPLLAGSAGPSQRGRTARPCQGDRIRLSNVCQPDRRNSNILTERKIPPEPTK